MTYPLPEGLSAGILNVGSQVTDCEIGTKLSFLPSQVLSIVVIVVMGRLIDTNHIPFGNWFLTGLTAFSALLASEYLRGKCVELLNNNASVLLCKQSITRSLDQ